MREFQIRRGDIFYVNRFGDTFGSEQRSGRPAIVVSNDMNNEFSQTIEIVYCTTKPKKDLPTHVTVWSTNTPSTVLCEQISTVDKNKLGDYIGNCNEGEMKAIDEAMCISLDLSCHPDTKPKVVDPPAQVQKKSNEDIDAQRVAIERDMYKRMYESLLDRLVPVSADNECRKTV